MLHGGGWFEELRSNRWHFARHFAKSAAVLVAEASNHDRGSVFNDDRLPGVTVMRVEGIRPFIDSPRRSAILIKRQLHAMKAENPVLWLSSPLMWNVAAHLRDIPVVFHATEDYVQLTRYNPHPAATYILDCALEAARSANATLTCSSGVTDSLRTILHDVPIISGSNGVALHDYGTGRPEERVDVSSVLLSQCAIFAGNVNKRLDIALLDRIAQEIPQLTILLVGPIVFDESRNAMVHKLMDRANVRHIESVSTPALNYLYLRCLFGLVPYTNEPVIVTSGFPLKTLEMVAAGLHIVSTHLDQTHGLSRVIHCSHTHDEFINNCRRLIENPVRVSSTDDDVIALLNRYSYDRLIPDSLRQVEERVQNSPGVHRRVVRPRVRSTVRDTIRSLIKSR